MARPKLDPNAPAPPKDHIEAMERGTWTVGQNEYTIDVSDIPEDNPENETLTQLEGIITGLLKQRAETLEKLGKARTSGHSLRELGIGSREQAAFLMFYLPQKTRKGSSDESEGDEVESPAEGATAE